MRWRNRSSLLVAAIALGVSIAGSASSFASPAASASPGPQFVYAKQYAMGTVFEIAAYSRAPERASRAMAAALRAVVSLDDVMSNYDPASDLSRLNRRAHYHAVRVPPDLFRVIQASIVYSRLSGGKYDVTIAPLVDVWKAAAAGGPVPSAASLSRLRRCVGYQKLELVEPDEIEFHSDCMRIDLGSIGKGYAVDRAAEVLKSYGVRNALINAGGSTLLGMGSPPDRDGWDVRLRDPSGRADPEVTLSNDSVSTSEQAKSSLIDSGRFGHIIDPTSARPMGSNLAVSVVAATGTESDGLSTTLLLVGPDAGGRLIRQLPHTAAIWIGPAGFVREASSGESIRLGRPARANESE